MRSLWTSIVLLAGPAVAITASADPLLRNVTGFDPGLLAGKTCQGVFNTVRRREGSQGALQIRFAVAGDFLTAHLWRRLGKPAYAPGAYPINQPVPNHKPSGLHALG